MKTTMKSRNFAEFFDLDTGVVFERDDALYVKTDEHEGGGSFVNAVHLCGGEWDKIGYTEVVEYFPDAELIY